MNCTVSVSQRGFVLFCLWHIWFIWVKYWLKGSRICFSNKSYIPWEFQRSAVMVFTLFHNSQIRNIIINIYVHIYSKRVISIAFSVLTVYKQLWEILKCSMCHEDAYFSPFCISRENLCLWICKGDYRNWFGSILILLFLL